MTADAEMKEKKERKPMVGYGACSIYDQDCYAKRTKGSVCHDPMFVDDLPDGGKKLTMYMSDTSKLDYLELPNDADHYFHVVFWWGAYGKQGERNDNLICQAVHKPCGDIHKGLEKSKGEPVECEATVPFMRDCHHKDNKQKMFVTIVEKKFVTRVTKVEVHLTKAAVEAWYASWEERKEAVKDDDKDKDKDKDKDSKKE